MGNYFQAAISWFILSTIFLTLPGTAFPTESWLSVVSFDKLVHLGIFSVMVILLCWAVYKKDSPGKIKTFILCAIAALAYGIAIEFVQKYLIPNRSFDITDIVADGTGSLIGLLYSLKKYIKK
ncbi:MAG: VanZ family protein [Chitinophagaceae bacterium]